MPKSEPATLADVMGKRLFNFAVVEAYYLQYDHGLMAFTPAIRTDTGDMAVSLQVGVIEEIRELLEADRRRKVKIRSALFLTNGTVGFFLSNELRGKAKAVQVLTHQQVEQLCTGSTEPFRLASNVA